MVCAIEGGSADLDTVVGRLDDGILFCMKAPAEFMPFSGRNLLFLTETPDIQTVIQSGRRAVVARRQNLLVLDKDSPHLSSKTRGPLGHEMGNVHKILFPRGPLRMVLFLFFLCHVQWRAMKRMDRTSITIWRNERQPQTKRKERSGGLRNLTTSCVAFPRP